MVAVEEIENGKIYCRNSYGKDGGKRYGKEFSEHLKFDFNNSPAYLYVIAATELYLSPGSSKNLIDLPFDNLFPIKKYTLNWSEKQSNLNQNLQVPAEPHPENYLTIFSDVEYD